MDSQLYKIVVERRGGLFYIYIHTHIYLDRREALCPLNIYFTLIKNVDKLKFRVIYQVFLISKD